jgi:hypothetical protein
MGDPDTNTPNIINLLKQCSTNGLSFEQAKEKLISQGYSEAAINLATDSYQYGSQETPDIPEKVTEYFDQHPDKGIQDGAELLQAKAKEDATDERMQAGLDLMAEDAAPDLQSGVTYQHKFSDDVGISYWLLVVLTLGVNAAAYFLVTWLMISNWFYLVNGVLTLILAIILIKRIR